LDIVQRREPEPDEKRPNAEVQKAKIFGDQSYHLPSMLGVNVAVACPLVVASGIHHLVAVQSYNFDMPKLAVAREACSRGAFVRFVACQDGLVEVVGVVVLALRASRQVLPRHSHYHQLVPER
jgi:hypothetical protein